MKPGSEVPTLLQPVPLDSVSSRVTAGRRCQGLWGAGHPQGQPSELCFVHAPEHTASFLTDHSAVPVQGQCAELKAGSAALGRSPFEAARCLQSVTRTRTQKTGFHSLKA